MPFMRFPGMPVIARVYAILAKYAVLGVVPVAIPPIIPDIPDPLEEIPTQTGTDLAYIRQLASQAGYVFYVEPGPLPAQSIAYFGPDIRIPAPQPALNVNMDAQTNVESLSFSLDGLAKKIIVLTVIDPVTKKIPIPIPVPNIEPAAPADGRAPVPSQQARIRRRRRRARSRRCPQPCARHYVRRQRFHHWLRVARRAALRPASLRSRMMVGVRGAGLAYDGLYYVNSVTHNLKRGEYKQSFNLSRDGLISNTPVVIP